MLAVSREFGKALISIEKGHTFPRLKETRTKEMTSEETRSLEEKQRQEGPVAER